jgi:hypothetical protein
MIRKRLHAITEADGNSLKAEWRAEDNTIEYKSKLPEKTSGKDLVDVGRLS